MLQRLLDRLATDWALKLTALALAFLLWTNVRADEQMQWDADIEVRVMSADAEWVVADIEPSSVNTVFVGPYRELLRTASERPQVILNLSEIEDSVHLQRLRADLVRMPPGTERTQVMGFRPNSVRIIFDRVSARLIPVAVQLRGQPAAGTRMSGPPLLEPNVVRASGPGRRLSRVDSLRLPYIDLTGRTDTDTLDVTIDTTGTGLILSPRTVRVILPIAPATDSMPLPLLGQPRGRDGG